MSGLSMMGGGGMGGMMGGMMGGPMMGMGGGKGMMQPPPMLGRTQPNMQMQEIGLKQKMAQSDQSRQSYTKMLDARNQAWKNLDFAHQQYVGGGKMNSQQFFGQPWVRNYIEKQRSLGQHMGLPDDSLSKVSTMASTPLPKQRPTEAGPHVPTPQARPAGAPQGASQPVHQPQPSAPQAGWGRPTPGPAAPPQASPPGVAEGVKSGILPLGESPTTQELTARGLGSPPGMGGGPFGGAPGGPQATPAPAQPTAPQPTSGPSGGFGGGDTTTTRSLPQINVNAPGTHPQPGGLTVAPKGGEPVHFPPQPPPPSLQEAIQGVSKMWKEGIPGQQGTRPFKIGGEGTLPSGRQFTWVSGGAKRGSMPFGDFPVTPGTVGKWGAAHQAIGINNNVIHDPKYPGKPREGIEIHRGSSAVLNRAQTAGCFGIDPKNWPAARQEILSEAKKGPLYLHVGADNKATFYHNKSDLPAATAQAGPQKTAENQKTMLFLHGLETRYLDKAGKKIDPAVIEGQAKRYAEGRGWKFEAIPVSGDKRQAQLAAANKRMAKGDVGGVLGFSAGGYTAAGLKTPKGVEKIIVGAPKARGDREFKGGHMDQVRSLADSIMAKYQDRVQ